MCGCHLNSIVSNLVTAEGQPAYRENDLKAETKPELACWHCKNSLSPEFTWCPQCGVAVKAHPCLYCGQMLSPQDAVCPSCGAPSKRS